jgi:type IV pilus assembly protein PilC
MASYRYKGVDELGKMRRGVMEAATLFDLETRLKAMGMELINAAEVRALLPSFGRRRIDRRDLITFCFHLEQQVNAGVPLVEGLKDLRDSVDNTSLREVTAALVEQIEGGRSLSQAMDAFPKTFDRVFVNLIRAGERSGRLSDILKTLTENLKWQDEVASQAKKALMYPAFVAVSVVGVVVSLMVFLVPELVKFLLSTNKELPAQTRALIWVSSSLRDYGHWLLLGVMGSAVAFIAARSQSARFARWLDGVTLRLWVVGPVQRKLVIARFAHHFALLYSAGITVLECLKVSEGIMGNRVLADAIREAGVYIADGHTLSASFERTGLFPRLVVRMLKVGETTGVLDTALNNISYFYNRDVRDSLERMQTLIGPAMTVVLGGMLLWVIMSVVGPIYGSLTRITM